MDWIKLASEAMSTPLRQHGTRRAVGPCPFCAKYDGYGGDDRFICFDDGGWICSHCRAMHRQAAGWWQVPEDVQAIRDKQQERKASAKELYTQMHGCQDWIGYTKAVWVHLDKWAEHGITEQTVIENGLGYCHQAPGTNLPSLTIPVFYGGKLYDIRHRLLGGDEGQKYRSHLPGLVPIYYGLDAIATGQPLLVVEGEKKAIVLKQFGLVNTLAYPGVNFLGQITHYLAKCGGQPGQELIFTPDPGTTKQVIVQAHKLRDLGYKPSLVDCPGKPDDFVLRYGVDVLKSMIELRRYL